MWGPPKLDMSIFVVGMTLAVAGKRIDTETAKRLEVALPRTGIDSLCLCKTTLILSPTIVNTSIGDSELMYLSGGIALTPTIQQIDLGTLYIGPLTHT